MFWLDDSTLHEALFASDLQPSEHPNSQQVRAAIRHTLMALGLQGCAASVAHEFGEHPDTAVVRMRWARHAVAWTRPYLDGYRPATGGDRACRSGGLTEFLDLGDGAHQWLVDTATRATQVRAKMARAVKLAVAFGVDRVDTTLGLATTAGRFDEHDLDSILERHSPTHQQRDDADDRHPIQPGTTGWGRSSQ